MDLIAHPNPAHPFAGNRTRPAGRDDAHRKAMPIGQCLAVHFPRQEGVRLHHLPHRSATRDDIFRGVAGEVHIAAVIAGIDGTAANAGGVEHIGHAHAGPARAADRAGAPLIAARRRIERGAPIAAAFDLEREGVGGEIMFQICERQAQRIVDLAIDRQFPVPCIARTRGLRHQTVVADKMAGIVGDRVIEEMCRCLGVERPVVEQAQAILAFDYKRLMFRRRPCRRHQPARHVTGERNGCTERRAHGGQACALEKAASAKRQRVGAPGIVSINFRQTAFGCANVRDLRCNI